MSETPVEPITHDATPEPTASAEPSQPSTDSTPPWGDDFDAERAWKTITNLREREKELSKTQLTPDQRVKLDEFERLAEASQTDLERAQRAAQDAEGRVAAFRDRAVGAEIRAALAGVVPDPSAVIEDLNLARFVGEDGEVDVQAVNALRTKYAAFAPADRPGMKPNPSQGRSASPSPTVAEQIAQAQEAGDTRTAIRLKSQMALNASDS